MILEVDAGNTRIKWRLIKESANGELLKEAEGTVVVEEAISSVFVKMSSQIESSSISKISRMRVSSVRGEPFEEVFSSMVEERWGLCPEFSRVERACGGVVNSYLDEKSMGVDRWLAMLAAYKNVDGACCIVDCGSALTLDLVAANGEHKGGYIVPGLSLMQKSLAEKSTALNFSGQCWGDTDLGNDTKAAVNNGILSMVLGLLERVHCEYEGGETVQWFVTGGDASTVSSHMVWEHKVVADLVMDGLSISLP